MGRIKIKFKLCAYCLKEKPIFRNVPRKGPQCLDCYKYEKMKSKNYKKARATKREILKKADTQNLSYRIKKADELFSKLIRKTYQMGDGLIFCYTCDQPLLFAQAQCGHYVSRGNLSTRWLTANCRPQCDSCNKMHEVNPSIFKARLELDIPGITEHLELLGRELYKPTRDDMGKLIDTIRKQLKEFK